mmetsp:Transcript_42725/g.93225  ORF Transcript_42725/g.93225 Transcript_42725/m.93225 type:complete len:236 (+) Transcript_42725:64-771(+)
MRVSVSTVALIAGKSQGPLESPNLTGYDPKILLCSHNGTVQGWCADWLDCIKAKSAPDGMTKVMQAWKPADCKEFCGVYPVTTTLLQTRAEPTACLNKCSGFQTNLADCVGTILFEPGKLSAMQSKKSAAAVDPICTQKNTACLPDLTDKYQQCVLSASRKKLQKKDHGHDEEACKTVKSDYEDCKSCPALSAAGGSKYTAFVGGCIDQLNAYWQATHPNAKEAKIPGAAGCQVH